MLFPALYSPVKCKAAHFTAARLTMRPEKVYDIRRTAAGRGKQAPARYSIREVRYGR